MSGMATDGDLGKSVIAKLNSSNYQLWKLKMKVLLWDLISQPKPCPIPEGWIRKECKAIAAICLTVEDDQLIHLAQLETAREMWQTLQRLHERASIGRKLYLMHKLYGMRFTHGTMQSHINGILEIVTQLRDLGKNIEDDDLVAIMLCSLPDSYSALVTALEGRDEADLTVEYVSGKLFDEYQRRTESCLDQSSNEVALNTTASNARSQFRASKAILTKSDNESRRCYYCGKKGHIKANCCKLKLQREKDEKARYGVHHNELFPINQETNAMQYRTFATREKAYKGKIGDWYVDSGATSHMTCNRNFFESLEQRKSTVYLADNTAIQTEGIGHGWLFCVTPDAQRITNNGYKIMFQDDTCLTSYQKEVVAEAKLDGSLFKLKQKHQIDTALSVHTYACLHKWHRRMGHIDPEAIRKLNREQLANSIDIRKCDAENDCEICLTGKMTLTPFTKVANRAKKQIELIHSDICGPMPTATPSDHRYMMTLIDDYSRFTVVYLLKTKDEAVDRIKDYVATLHTKFGRNPATLRTDNGREEKGIEHQFSAPYTPQQNGAAERKNRALVEMAKCMLTDAKLPERFWDETVCTAAYLQNRLPSRSILKTPFELGTGIKPNVDHIRIFGSKAYSYIPKQKRRKWDNKAREGVIVGYGGTTKGYRLLNPTTNETWISRSVKIIEDDSHIKNESAVPKGAIERSREYEDIPKLLKKEDNVIQAQKAKESAGN
ncbi:Retrovirus-related Pol polyprotein from transposon TNT 1-94 [Trichinella murrelli]|uniref:Retrovirus-related Pol polyprotein from transposon TNT 1-94 n=1 Tax=Trichinella murrelli TaxID=144512 RepID=A0A0V0TIL6_9BILA|nr:Retrovirus-related Pol polyprotein from transposon TNT 1-94 [Trichinella murrelli]